MEKKIPRVLFNRVLVFSMPEAEHTESGIFLGHKRRGRFGNVTECWVVTAGPLCDEPFSQGSRVIVSDQFELEPTNLDLWKTFENDPAFASLRQAREKIGGRVVTQLVSENSILAVVEGDD